MSGVVAYAGRYVAWIEIEHAHSVKALLRAAEELAREELAKVMKSNPKRESAQWELTSSGMILKFTGYYD